MVVFENILVGRVVAVEARSALVLLPTDLTAKIPVVVKKPLSLETEIIRAASGIQAKGLLGSHSESQLAVEKIVQSEDVHERDLVLTSGENDWLPDLLIGQVETVLEEGAAIYKRALVKPLVDYANLKTVFLVTDY